MASQSHGKEKDEQEELEEELKSLTCRKKDVFEKTKETDRELWEIRQREIAVKERLHKLSGDKIEVEQLRQALERLQIENANLKELQSQRAAESDSKIKSVEAELSYVKETVALYEREVTSLTDDILGKEMLHREVVGLKDKILEKDNLQDEMANLQAELSSMKGKFAVCEREHGGADDLNKIQEQLRKIKDAMQSITRYSKSQRDEKEQALRRVASLERDVLENEKLQREMASLKNEILEKDKLQEEVAKLQASLMNYRVAECEREHGLADDVNDMKQELETLRYQTIEQSAALRKVKDAMQRVTSYSKTQQKEKEDALKRVASLEQEVLEKEKLRREVASLKDEIATLRLISEETQQRQLNQLQSSKKQQQQPSTGKVNELNLCFD